MTLTSGPRNRASVAQAYALPDRRVRIIADEVLLRWLTARLPSAAGDAAEDNVFRIVDRGGAWGLQEDGRDFVFRGTREAAAVRLLERLNELACFSTGEPTVHSGLVSDDVGRGIWIPAASGGGKSTLTAQLALSGLRYGTDEVVTVGGSGLLTGWPKWLNLKRGSYGVLEQLAPHPDEPVLDDGRWIVPPHRVGRVAGPLVVPTLTVLPQYRAGSGIEIAQITRAEAVAALVPHALNLKRQGLHGVHRLAQAVRRSSICLRVTYGDGWETSQRLIEALGRTPA